MGGCITSDSFIVTKEETHLRLDKLLSIRFSMYSRNYFQSLIEQGCVLVNGSVYKKRDKTQEGDEIEICFLLTPELSFEPENIPLDVLYEDPFLLAINKPPGMVVHPAAGHPNSTFVNALLFHCRSLEVEDPLRPGIVHRLDKDTSGVLLAAKTQATHRALVAMFAERKIEKKYIGVCIGKAKEGLIDAPIARHPIRRKEMCVCHTRGREAKSIVRIKHLLNTLSVVEITLLTGRTHQIRVHLKHCGTPLLGDPIYGSCARNTHFKIARQLLHAESIRLIHPITHIPLHVTAPIPEDMVPYLKEQEKCLY